MEDRIKTIAEMITLSANTEQKNKRVIKYSEDMNQEYIESLKTELKSQGWRVNRRGESLILTR